MNVTALIAEDEPLLALNLRAELERAWPGIEVVATVGDGASAVTRSLALQPDLLFLDIRMPGMSGLEAAEALAEDWPDGTRPFPLIVFVTAYDQYALQAFDRAAVDYVLKPVQPERLAQTCTRLRALLQGRSPAHASKQSEMPAIGNMVAQLRQLLEGSSTGAVAAATAPAYLRVIQVALGNTIQMVPIDTVLYFEAADKYVRVVTAEREHVIRLSLRELQPQLDAASFWQIHRGTIVRCEAIAAAQRDEAGKLTLRLHGHPERLNVSRLYAHLFKGL
jgi:DNA-binding LytR/AlgR family response regulator